MQQNMFSPRKMILKFRFEITLKKFVELLVSSRSQSRGPRKLIDPGIIGAKQVALTSFDVNLANQRHIFGCLKFLENVSHRSGRDLDFSGGVSYTEFHSVAPSILRGCGILREKQSYACTNIQPGAPNTIGTFISKPIAAATACLYECPLSG